MSCYEYIFLFLFLFLLQWNVAFAAVGIANAVRAVLPGDADWPEDYSAGDIRYSSISW